VYFLIKSFFPVRIEVGAGKTPVQNPNRQKPSQQGEFVDYEDVTDEK